MELLTQAQLNQIAKVFGLTAVEATLPVRDGIVFKTDKVWWRGDNGPEHVLAGDSSHWQNIRIFPSVYQIARPQTEITYLD